MKREKLLASGAWLLMVSAIVAQSPVDGGKVPSPLSPYGQIGSAVIKKEQGTNEKKELELPAMEVDVDKVPLGAIPREGAAPLYPRFFLGGEYLAWKLNNTTLNPIVFNVPVGIVGAPIAIGVNDIFFSYASLTPQSQASFSQNGIINYGMENGMRFTGGLALEQDTGLSVLLNAIIIPTSSFNLSSNTSFNMVPINFQTGLSSQVPLGGAFGADIEVATIPIVVPRNVASQVYASANNFVGGGEVDLKGRDLFFGDVIFSGLLGFRYFQFNESLGVNSIYELSQAPPNRFGETPDQVQDLESNFSDYQSIKSVSSDNIKVYNNFLGPQIGINSNYNFNRFTFDCNGKLGIGVQHQVVTINSSTTQTFKLNATNGATTTTSTLIQNHSGGLLFSPYDVGRHSRNQFGLIPELNLKLGYRLFDRLKITAGYDFLMMANVLRASNQTQLIPYTTQSNFSGMAVQQQTSSQSIQIPAFTFDNSNLIINGLNVGMQLDF